MTQSKHSSDRELMGQGIGNMLCAIFGGIPGAGATMRTVVNIKNGGRTRISGMTHSLILLLILLGASQYTAQIPMAVLSGILITVGIGIIDYRGLKHLHHVPKTDACIMLTVLGLTVFVDLLQAVAVGMILAAFFFMKKSSDLAEEKTRIGPVSDYIQELPWPDDKLLPEHLSKQVYIKHIEGPLFFGFISQFKMLIQTIPEVKYVIIRMKNVPYVDQSGLYALEDAIFYLKSTGVQVILTGLQSQPRDMLTRLKIIPTLVEEKNIFKHFADSIQWLGKKLGV